MVRARKTRALSRVMMMIMTTLMIMMMEALPLSPKAGPISGLRNGIFFVFHILVTSGARRPRSLVGARYCGPFTRRSGFFLWFDINFVYIPVCKVVCVCSDSRRER